MYKNDNSILATTLTIGPTTPLREEETYACLCKSVCRGLVLFSTAGGTYKYNTDVL